MFHTPHLINWQILLALYSKHIQNSNSFYHLHHYSHCPNHLDCWNTSEMVLVHLLLRSQRDPPILCSKPSRVSLRLKKLKFLPGPQDHMQSDVLPSGFISSCSLFSSMLFLKVITLQMSENPFIFYSLFLEGLLPDFYMAVHFSPSGLGLRQ